MPTILSHSVAFFFVAPAWPCCTHFCFLSWPLRGLPLPPWPYFAHFASSPAALLPSPCSLCFLSWPLRGHAGIASLTLLPVIALAWPHGPRGLAYFASRHGWNALRPVHRQRLSSTKFTCSFGMPYLVPRPVLVYPNLWAKIHA